MPERVDSNTLANPLSQTVLRVSSVPRNHGHNTVFGGTDFDIELGNTADEAKDDSGKRSACDGNKGRDEDGRAPFATGRMGMTVRSGSVAAVAPMLA